MKIEKMDEELKGLYVYMLKYKWIPKSQSMRYWNNGYKYYYVDLTKPNEITTLSFYLRGAEIK